MDQGARPKLFKRQLFEFAPHQEVGVELTVAGEAVETMQFEMLGELGQAQEALERALLHAGNILEPHMMLHQGFHLLGLIPGKPETAENPTRDAHALFHMAIEADAVRQSERRGLADVV